VASIIFYATYGIDYLIFILVSIFVVFKTAQKIDLAYQQGDAEAALTEDSTARKQLKLKAKSESRKWLLLALFSVLIPFIALRYFNFLVGNLNSAFAWFGAQYRIDIINRFLPVGISFYSFMMLGYLLDVYWRRYPAEQKLMNFATFGLYFPHIVQGPIGRYQQFSEQISRKQEFSWQNITLGSQLMIWGFFKKLVVADRVNIFVSSIYDNWAEQEGLILIIATVLYSIQIYADFSGCIDIITGASELFGIKLEKNFEQPYLSKTMPEFWRRWHMSLNRWFKDYLYYPVSISGFVKKYSKKIKQKKGAESARMFVSVISAFIVWIVTGLWHGAEWKYVVWGLFHATLIICGIVFDKPIRHLTALLKIKTERLSWKTFQILRTFTLCCIGRVFFRADDLHAAIGIFKQTFAGSGLYVLFGGNIYYYGLLNYYFRLMLVSVVFLLAVDLIQSRLSIRLLISRQPLIIRWLIIYAGIFAVLLLGVYGPGYDSSAFIYNQF